MNAKISTLALAALTGMSMAAVTTVMYFEDGKYTKGEIAPIGWYPYKSPEKNSTVSIDTATTKTYKEIVATVSKTVESSAGVSLAWKAKDAAIDLSAFKGMGVCLTYTATAEFRMDLKQTTVADYNYHGVIVPAQSAMETVYFPFADFEQEDWGDETITKALNLAVQTGIQFSYKTALATESGVNSNTIHIAAISLGSSCVNNAPTLKTGVTSPADVELLEGDTLKIALNDIFVDEDGDDLNVVMAATGFIDDLKGAKSYGLKDVVWVGSQPNPKEGATGKVTLTATDAGGKSVSYVVNLTLVDRANPPVAVDDRYEMNEDDTLTVTVLKGVLANDYDPDGDDFEALLASVPENGALTFNGSGFIYIPNPDFHGEDSFTYALAGADSMTSGIATVTIVVNDVNDPATIRVTDSTMHIASPTGPVFNMADGIALDEDFEPLDIFIPVGNVVFEDPDVDGSNFPLSAKTAKGLLNVEYGKIGQNYVLSLTPVENAYGSDVVRLFAVDGKDTISLDINVVIAAVADLPVAVNDTFTVIQDSANFIPAKQGVLANDYNPDGKSTLKAYLLTEPKHGTAGIDTTGAVLYEAEKYEGIDSLTYVIVNAEGQQSEPATVVFKVMYKNSGPLVKKGVIDTVGTRTSALREDFSASIVFKATEVKSWFEDAEGDAITLNAVSPDSLLNVTINATGAITVKSVKDACGETSVDVIATDAKKNATTLSIPVSITCINDKPMRIGGAVDTILVTPNAWRKVFHVLELFEDPDDSVLTMKVMNADKIFDAKVEGDSLIVKLADEKVYLQNLVPYTLKVTVTDEAGESAVAKSLTFMVGDNKTSMPVVAAVPKATWQSAILAERGMAAIMDVQGRVMWKAKLPVSEADVRNAAAKVQGRKILQVNKQVWTIK